MGVSFFLDGGAWGDPAGHPLQRKLCVPSEVLPSPHPKAPSRPRAPHLTWDGGRAIPGGTAWLTQHCRPQEERPPYHRYRKGGSVGGLCYLSVGMVVLLMGLVFASVYIYRYFFLAQVRTRISGTAAVGTLPSLRSPDPVPACHALRTHFPGLGTFRITKQRWRVGLRTDVTSSSCRVASAESHTPSYLLAQPLRAASWAERTGHGHSDLVVNPDPGEGGGTTNSELKAVNLKVPQKNSLSTVNGESLE